MARGPVLVVLWFLAPPVSIQSDEQGGWSISLGATRGQYEVVSRSCAGDFLSSRPVPVTTGGTVAEYEPVGSPFRLAGFAGLTSIPSDAGADGSYFGGLVAWETRVVGLGVGPVWVPGGFRVRVSTDGTTTLDPAHETVPSLYLRLGSREGGSFQADFFAPSAIPGATGLLRAGVVIRGERTRTHLGLSTLRALDVGADGDNGGPFGEFSFPVGSRMTLTAAGSVYEFEKHFDGAVGLALKYRF